MKKFVTIDQYNPINMKKILISPNMRSIQFHSIRHEILFFGAIALIIVSAAIIGYASLSQYAISVDGSKTIVSAIAERKQLF
jgi:hypothetical protein